VRAEEGNGPATSSRRHIFSHPQDFHCVIFHFACLIAFACAFWLYQHPRLAGISGPWSRVAFAIGTAYVLGWITAVNVGVNFHNHAHRPIFTSPFLNRWFGRFWTFSGGWPSFFWEYSHLTVHHAKLLSAEDWTLPRQNADGSFEDFRVYALAHWPWRYMVHMFRDLTSGHGLRRKALREFAIFLALWSIPFWIDPIMALWLWALPQWMANVLVMGPGMYVQHAGCVRKSAARPMSHSTVFLSKFLNLTMFNIGYHLEHHDHPRVHWSELPDLHQRLKKDLIEGGAHVVPYGFFHAAFLLAGDATRRTRFAEQAFGYAKEPELSATHE
jgi:fatty acid desaturase